MFQHLRKVLLPALLSFAFFCSPGADAQLVRGEKSFGVRAGYVTRNSSASAGLTFTYAFSKHVRIAPTADIFFRHKDLDALAISIDMHFPIALGSPKAAFYPIAGLGFTSWGRHDLDPESSKDVTSHSAVFGLNAGAGFEYRPTPSMRLSVEGRYTLMRHYPNALFTAGIGFIF